MSVVVFGPGLNQPKSNEVLALCILMIIWTPTFKCNQARNNDGIMNFFWRLICIYIFYSPTRIPDLNHMSNWPSASAQYSIYPISAVALCRNTSSSNFSRGTPIWANAPGPVGWQQHRLMLFSMLRNLVAHMVPTAWTSCQTPVLRLLSIQMTPKICVLSSCGFNDMMVLSMNINPMSSVPTCGVGWTPLNFNKGPKPMHINSIVKTWNDIGVLWGNHI